MEYCEFLGAFGVEGDVLALVLALLLRRLGARDGAARRADVLARGGQGGVRGRDVVGPEGVLDGRRGGVVQDFGPDVVSPVGGDGGEEEGLQGDVFADEG